ncbi:HAD family phosphatase [Sphingobacterium sp. SRCM116780]|uniref:HAD family hydrolase n=1 Tax=Sphingobacterium sp. SRCM116780 TaxID=2907623 RepID=UPI001F2087FF|nr:HAD family phosphatase [Sphingobacterium sp. SRCM116780]UIR56759.1 HAD family phosphatase [Sphingobacterium sp. SRCM116780]
MKTENIIFDFGGVLVDWNPRYLYKDHFQNKNEMEHFLKNICTDEWNLEQDRGRSLSDGTVLLQKKFPEFYAMIQLFYDRWETMLRSDIPETVSLLYKLKAKYKIYGLTNWSAETISIAYDRFSFFEEFDGIVVSGQEKMIKPDRQIYHLLLDRYNLKAEHTIFIDDNINNVKTAEEIGLYGIHFESPSQLETRLSLINVI